jgi:hypothetical protein
MMSIEGMLIMNRYEPDENLLWPVQVSSLVLVLIWIMGKENWYRSPYNCKLLLYASVAWVYDDLGFKPVLIPCRNIETILY